MGTSENLAVGDAAGAQVLRTHTHWTRGINGSLKTLPHCRAVNTKESPAPKTIARVDDRGEFAIENTLSFLALADPNHRRNRPAPDARRLATGVGSRVTTPGTVTNRLGSP